MPSGAFAAATRGRFWVDWMMRPVTSVAFGLLARGLSFSLLGHVHPLVRSRPYLWRT